MFLKTAKGEQLHRKRKREMEMSKALRIIRRYFKKDNKQKILEIGSGDGFQVPYLKKLGGDLTASDIYTSQGIKSQADLNFVECDIRKAPFEANSFDLIFSSHVIEHIQNLEAGLKELQRIGTRDCYYAFIVPTNIWLLLTIPASYLRKIKLFVLWIGESITKKHGKKRPDDAENEGFKKNFLGRILSIILPSGHGAYKSFAECFKMFRVTNWQHILENNGFQVIKTAPLLLYGPSRLPIIPTLEAKGRFYSSVLFILRSY